MKNNPHSINKEFAAFILTIFLIIILMMCFVSSFGQEVDSVRPRIVSILNDEWMNGPPLKLIVHVKTVKIGTIEIDEDEAKEYFKDCYEHGDTVFIKTWIDYSDRGRPHTKKEITTLSAMAREYNDRLRKEGRFLGDGIFIMVRMPSEQDYIKWLHNKK